MSLALSNYLLYTCGSNKRIGSCTSGGDRWPPPRRASPLHPLPPSSRARPARGGRRCPRVPAPAVAPRVPPPAAPPRSQLAASWRRPGLPAYCWRPRLPEGCGAELPDASREICRRPACHTWGGHGPDQPCRKCREAAAESCTQRSYRSIDSILWFPSLQIS